MLKEDTVIGNSNNSNDETSVNYTQNSEETLFDNNQTSEVEDAAEDATDTSEKKSNKGKRGRPPKPQTETS